MEGGSRQSRASSRYASPAVFNGPVRKWKKQWVTSLSNNKRNDAAPLLLCRWTPLSAADEPPTRRLRYTPVVPIEKGKMKSEGSSSKESMNGAGMETSVDISKEQLQPQELIEDPPDSNKTKS